MTSRKTCYLFKCIGFSVQKKWETISSASDRDIRGGQIRELKNKGLLIYNPKNNYLRSSSKKLKIPKEKMEKSCSSEKERKVNALALRAEEGRDYLR